MTDWRPYVSYAHKRGVRCLRIGVWRVRRDRICFEYRWLEISTFLGGAE